MTLGEKIKQIRISAKKSQKEFSEMLDVSPSIISDWENNKKRPRHKNIKQMANLFKKPISYFLEDDDPIEYVEQHLGEFETDIYFNEAMKNILENNLKNNPDNEIIEESIKILENKINNTENSILDSGKWLESIRESINKLSFREKLKIHKAMKNSLKKKSTLLEEKITNEPYNNSIRFTDVEFDVDKYILLDCVMAVKAGNNTLIIENIDRKSKFYRVYLPPYETEGLTDEQIQEKFKTVIVEGNSMYPEYFDGDELIIKKINGNFIDGKKYIITIGNCAMVKKIFKTKDKITLISINDKEFPPRELTPKDFEVQHITIDYRVVKLLRDE